MPRIALVNTPFFGESTYSISYSKNPYPNLSLAYLAGFLETQHIDVNVIDGKFSRLTLADILAELAEINPKIIGFTSMTTEIGDVYNTLSAVKQEFPDVTVVLGGMHASALPRETLEANKDIDVLAVGEGEETLLELYNRTPLNRIPSICYREHGATKTTPSRELKDIDGYGAAAFHHWKGASCFHVATYRGCPFNCSFCFRVLGHRVRLRKLDDVMSDIGYVVSQGAELNLCDATFGLKRSHTESILNEMINRGLKVSWSAATRVDIVDRPMLELMQRAGCTKIAFGIESGSDQVLKRTSKNISLKTIREAVDVSKEVGLDVTGYYVFGHPNETKADVRRTTRIIWELNTSESIIGIMTPWPGTRVYELARQDEGGYRLLHKRFSEYDKHYGTAIEFDNYSLRWLEMMRMKSYLNLYLRNFRFLDLVKFLWLRRRNVTRKLTSFRLGCTSSK